MALAHLHRCRSRGNETTNRIPRILFLGINLQLEAGCQLLLVSLGRRDRGDMRERHRN
jgi:hypothetical protein